MADKNPNDFMGDATQYYAGEKNAVRIAREADRKKKKTALDNIDPYYSQLFEDLAGNQQKATTGLQSSMARRGLTRSGIRTKAEGNLAGEYGKLNQQLTREKTTSMQNAQADYDAADQLVTNIDAEYAGKISQMATELYNNWRASQPSVSQSYGGGQRTAEQPMTKDGIRQILTQWKKSDQRDPSTHYDFRREEQFKKLANDFPEFADYIWSVGYSIYDDNWAKPKKKVPTGPTRASVPAMMITGKY